LSDQGSGKGPVLRWSSIGTKLAVVFLALAILPTAGTAYYNLTRSQGEVGTFAEVNLLVLSRSVATEVERLLVENLRTSATLAGEPLVVAYVAGTEEERQELAPQIDRTLRNFVETHPNYDTAGLMDIEGTVLASPTEQLVGRNYRFRDYFAASVGRGESYISDISVGSAAGVPSVFLTNPVVAEEGQIVGMDIIRLKGEAIWEIVDEVSVGEEGIAYLIDQDGVIIAHPNRELIYHSLGELSLEARETISLTKRFGTVEGSELSAIPESLGLDSLATRLLEAQGPGTYRYRSPLDRRYHVVGYTQMEAQPWTLVVDLPEDEFLAPLQRLGTVTWISVGVVGGIALVVSVLLAQGITRPVRRLSEAAVAVEHEQPFEPQDIDDVTSGRDEIAHLGRVFGDMVLALRRRMSELRTVYEIGQDITATLEVDETLQAILDRVRDVIDYDAAEITLFDRQEDALIVAAWSGDEDFVDTRERRYELGTGFTGVIGQDQHSLLVPDLEAESEREPVRKQLAEDVTVRALLGVPLLIRDHLVGTLELVSTKPQAFDENDQRLLETIAPQASIAIEKAQQVREREQKLKNQIAKLRIEIDEAKRQRQVSAITETDYFQQLAQQAERLRQQRQDETDE